MKRWTPGEWERLAPCLDAIVVDRDPDAPRRGHGGGPLPAGRAPASTRSSSTTTSPARTCRTSPSASRFTPPASWATRCRTILDLNGPYADVIRTLNMPASFVILDRVVWGMSALLGKLARERAVARHACPSTAR